MGKYLPLAVLVLLVSCEFGGDENWIYKAEVVDAKTMYVYITGKAVSTVGISIVVNDKNDYYFTAITYNILAGDDQGSVKRYNCKLNKDLQKGDKIKIEAGPGGEVNGSFAFTYD
jgi:hypothetical protein